jgi:hypothetical protein
LNAVRRRVCETFAVANMSKPGRPESPDATLGRIWHSLETVRSWTDQRLWLEVTDEARRQRFAECTWHSANVGLGDLAVWPRMGGLPSAATGGSAVDTAHYIWDNGIPRAAERLRTFAETVRHDAAGAERICRALPMIAVERNVLFAAAPGRPPLALDDGSHRAVILAMISPCADVEVLVGTRPEGAEGHER